MKFDKTVVSNNHTKFKGEKILKYLKIGTYLKVDEISKIYQLLDNWIKYIRVCPNIWSLTRFPKFGKVTPMKLQNSKISTIFHSAGIIREKLTFFEKKNLKFWKINFFEIVF